METCCHLVRMKYNRIMLTLCAAGILIFSGCASLHVKQYGFVAPDAKTIREEGSALFIPSSAHSISQGFKPQEDHEGIDIVGQSGTPVIAALGGIVISSYYEPLFGNRVVIDHGRDERGLFIKGRYFHLNKRLVHEGDKVLRGQQIGELGSTGILAIAPHLHYELRSGHKPDQYMFDPVNPHRFWADGVGVVTCFDPGMELPDVPLKTTYPVPCL